MEMIRFKQCQNTKMIVQLTSWFSFLQSLIWPFLALQLFLVCGTRFRQVHVCHDSVICSRNRPFAAQGPVTCLMQKLDSTSTKSEVERAWELPRKLILRWSTHDTKILQVIEYLYFKVSRVFYGKNVTLQGMQLMDVFLHCCIHIHIIFTP